jgi:ribosomal-protein-alanine N-acetyltransferase
MDVYCRFGQEHLAFLTLEVRASNQSAIGLYLKHGFEEVGRRKNFYADPQEDAIIMTREFDHGTSDPDQQAAD